MKKTAFIVYTGTLCFLLVSCQKQEKQVEEVIAEIREMPGSEAQPTISLPTMDLDLENFGGKGIEDGTLLSREKAQSLGLDRMDQEAFKNSSSYPGIQYFLLKDLYEGEEGSIKLLSRTYEMEILAWAATYNPDGKLLDFKPVFYDEFAESAHQMSSQISGNQIKVTEVRLDFETDEEKTETRTYTINHDLKFEEATP